MEALSWVGCFTTSSTSRLPRALPVRRRRRAVFTPTPPLSALRASAGLVGELVEEETLKTFLKERQLSGDFISKASDLLWQREALKLVEPDVGMLPDSPQEPDQVVENDDDGGFLKLSKTNEWISGDNSAPLNKKVIAKALQDDSEKRRKLNLLQYEALKRELMLLSIGIGTACTGYCLIVLSIQAAISYAVGVLFSCLYLQLLCQHADNLSREMIPQIYRKKKLKKIGIRSEDLSDSLERTIKGSTMVLSSPRLVIPAAIYGLWVFSHRYIGSDFFDFQLVPAMLGMFVYKAAALVQVYRDNEDLRLVFPENEEGSSY
ncbi:uncharacterized protein LOC115735341 isoform X2 [Rhodamnia argentea]|uniref:Uncharacterized protein LOC115735341 isoform X2 n=1 Tax=Rhodamnia argentea TaxID=178133 RepID=A0A8B8NJY5_9MYRT|nr:uncharacterized protein LOC115735341 isoform X2 [Rhodamnia argentea]